MKHYIERTKPVRTGPELFISYEKPHGRVSRQTFARWVRTVLEQAGIDVSVYAPHSARSASCSAASIRGVPLATILRAAGWTGSRTFAQFYKRDIAEDRPNFGQTLLDAFVNKPGLRFFAV